MKKILLVRNDRFGEFLLNIPAFRAVKETYPDAVLHVAVAPAVVELARCLPMVDQVLEWAPGEHWISRLRRVSRFLKEKYDAIVVLNPTKEAHFVSFLSGIPLRVGYACKGGRLLTCSMPDQKHLGRRHEVEHNLDLVGLLAAKTENKDPFLGLDPGFLGRVQEKFSLPSDQEIIAVHPYTSDPVKQWPLEFFEELVGRLSAEFSGRVLLCGKPELWHRDLFFKGDRIIDLRGVTTLVELAALLKFSKCLISCDSGPVHLASSVGTKVIVIFRDDISGKNPERWGPWGDQHCILRAPRLSAIRAEDIIDAIS